MPPVSRYRPSLDGVRAIAIALVMAEHAGLRVGRAGGLGVDVFFVLSGYLITGLLVRERESTGRIRLGAFYFRRAVRLFPALLMLVTLGALVVSHELHTSRRQLLEGGLIAATYLTDVFSFFPTTVWAVWGNTWSLAIEEHFYLLWPPLLLLLLRAGNRRIAIWFASVGAGLGTLALALLAEGSASVGPPRLYFQPQAHVGGLLLGCVVAMVPAAPRWSRHLAGFGGVTWLLLVLLAPPPTHASYYRLALPLTWLLAGAVLLGLEHDSPVSRALGSWVLRRVGAISYGLYLYHQVVFLVVADHLDSGKAAVVAVEVVLSLVLAELSFRYLESPLRRLGRRQHLVSAR